MTKLAIVIVNWNTGELLAKCLQSLVDLPDIERSLIDEVYVVDNASSDNSVARAKLVVGRNINQPRVRFIQHERNLGFAAANNIAFERIRDRRAAEEAHHPHVLLLNPDTEVREGALENMMNVLDKQHKVGIVGPKLLNPDQTVQESLRQFPTFTTFVLFMLKMGKLADHGDFDYEREQIIDQVMGSAFLIRNVLFDELGDLDEAFWVWFEEVDYCQRAYAAGWQVAYTPTAQIVHHGGISFGQLIGWHKTVPWLRSSLHYASKYLKPWEVGVLYMLSPLALLLAIPASLYHVLQRQQAYRRHA